jgi:hypothetical protein
MEKSRLFAATRAPNCRVLNLENCHSFRPLTNRRRLRNDRHKVFIGADLQDGRGRQQRLIDWANKNCVIRRKSAVGRGERRIEIGARRLGKDIVAAGDVSRRYIRSHHGGRCDTCVYRKPIRVC